MKGWKSSLYPFEPYLARLGMILASSTITPGPLVVECHRRSSGKSQVRRRRVLNKFASYSAKLLRLMSFHEEESAFLSRARIKPD